MLLLIVAAAVQAAVLAPAAPAPAPAKEKKICQAAEDVSSRIRYQQVCKTQSEWDAIAKETQADLQSSRNRRGTAPNN
jgi:hypothetical protein